MAMFADLEPRAPDAILGLMERFRADDRPDKVSLASGVYVDESGVTPVLDTVRVAEARVLEGQTTKVYKPIGGDPAYNRPVRDLVFGAEHPAVTGGRVETSVLDQQRSILINASDEDYEAIDAGDVVRIDGIRGLLERGEAAVLVNETSGREIPLAYDLTARQRGILLAGGRLNEGG